MNGHEELFHSFLCEWLEWARSYNEHDDDEHHSFNPYTGLCCCLENYLEYHGHFPTLFDSDSGYVYRNTMRVLWKMFGEDGLCTTFPFGQGAYDKDARNGTQHMNKERILWVEKTIKKLEAK
jgi:hypothetical protein